MSVAEQPLHEQAFFELFGGQQFGAFFALELQTLVSEAPITTIDNEVLPPLAMSVAEFALLQTLLMTAQEEGQQILGANGLPLIRPSDLANVKINLELGCWEKPIYKDGLDTFPGTNIKRARYGTINNRGALGKAKELAHRALYLQLVDEVETGLVLDHLCNNQRCCYPRHLEPTTYRTNNVRKIERTKLANSQTPPVD